MTRPLLIAQISDLHIKRPGELPYGKVHSAAGAQRLVAALNAADPAPDLVVLTGDVVDGGMMEEYAHARALLAPLRWPLLVCPGNHDDRVNLRAAFPEQAFATAGACNTRHDLGPLTLLLVDTSTPNEGHGTLDAETLSWLEGQLHDAAGRPVLIFLHHPPFQTGIWHMDSKNLRDAAVLEQLVRRHGQVRLVAAGHVHRAITTSFAGTVASIAPAPSHAVMLDLTGAHRPAFRFEPPGYHLHAWFPETAALVTHLVALGQFEGPYPFFAEDGTLL